MTALETAIQLLDRGLWPIPITPPDDSASPAPGKQPIGSGWGLHKHTPESLRSLYESHPKAGVGIKLGPDSGVIDIDVDDPILAGPVMLRMFAGEIPNTMGWTSARGYHLVFRWDERLTKYGKAIVRSHPNYPGVELRIGFSPEGENRQYQSVVPPSVGGDGKAREWNECETIGALPESFYDDLDTYLMTDESSLAPAASPWIVPPAALDKTDAYFRRALANAAGRVALSAEGNRHTALLTEAIAMGGHIHHGYLTETEIALELSHAARVTKLPEREIAAVIRDGLSFGRAKPLPWPDSLLKPSSALNEKLLAAINPIVPREEEEHVWEPPSVNEPPPIDSFPLDVLPIGLRELCEAGSAVMHTPVDYFAATAIGLAGGVMGRTVCLKARSSWDVIPNLYLAIVGPPGSKKSPALKLLAAPLFAIDHDLRDQYKGEKDAWKGVDAKDRGAEPVLSHLTMDDSTRESFAKILSENPRGLVLVKDELMAWVGDLNAYRNGKGSDEQFWMSLNSGSLVKVTRKGSPEPLVIPHPCGSVVGCLTPSSLPGVRASHTDNGWLDRILFSYPQQCSGVHEWGNADVPEDLLCEWKAAVGRLWSQRMIFDEGQSRPRPFFVHFTDHGLALWAKFYREHQLEKQVSDFPESLRGPWSKYEGFTLRLALILSQLHQAYDPTDTGNPRDVDAIDVQGAIRLIGYFKSHFRRVRTALTGETDSWTADAAAVLKWITEDKIEEFTKRDVVRRFRNFADRDRAEALDSLSRCGLIWFAGKRRAGDKPGRSREVFLVSPYAHTPRTEWSNGSPGSSSLGTIGLKAANSSFITVSPALARAIKFLTIFLLHDPSPEPSVIEKAAIFEIPEEDIRVAAAALDIERYTENEQTVWRLT